MRIRLSRPWLVAEFDRPLRVVSWALNRPGFVTVERIVWREVRNAELPEGFDAEAWFREELAAAGHSDAVGLLTSRDIRRHVCAHAEMEHVRADAIATVGLSNAERVGDRPLAQRLAAGTINIAVTVSDGLTEAGLLEALSIAVEARTAAVISHGPWLPGGAATGTGTDCIAIAAPSGEARYAGLHTATGHAVGRAVLDVVTRGVQDWMSEQGG